MTVKEACSYFDQSEIVNSQIDIDRQFYSALGKNGIYTDGEIKTNVTSEGYIHITSVKNATYIIFANREYETCLCVYKYIPEITCKYILENLSLLKSQIDNGTVEDDNKVNEEDTNTPLHSNDIIDINTFNCIECDSIDSMLFYRSETNPDVLEARCRKCGTEYTFVPSKYYKLASKRIIYVKSEESSRNINIKHKKPK